MSPTARTLAHLRSSVIGAAIMEKQSPFAKVWGDCQHWWCPRVQARRAAIHANV